MSVLLETTQGILVIDLDHQHVPLLALNFLRLCELNHYFFSPFHSLFKDQQVSCGLPNYPDETEDFAASHYVDLSGYDSSIQKGDTLSIKGLDLSKTQHSSDGVGVVSFVTSDNDTSVRSTFTLCLTPDYDKSSKENQIPFGRVVEGYDTLEKINNAVVDNLGRFVKDIRITHAHILHDPFPKQRGLKRKPFPSSVQQKHMRFPELNSEQDVQALSLELIGDLPHYKARPSPTTLFVARLNPVTTEEALKIVFGRFGKVQKCNIIKSYAFVELETEQQVEEAYSALHDGCIIDGNQVVVDFSQSVRRPRR